MKYIHSLWLRNNNYQYLIDNFHLYLLSALLVKKHGHTIELFCDKTTYECYSVIPYDKITILDYNEDGISSNFWVWGKIKPQLMMNETYVHIDADVFLFNDVIGDRLQNNEYSVVVQSIENEKTVGDGYYWCYVNSINPYEKFKEHNIDWGRYNMVSYNCGVVGFSDMELKNEYCNKVKDLLLDLSNDESFVFNDFIHYGVHCISEQTLLYYILNEKKIKPYLIIPHNDAKEFDYVWESKIPEMIGYSHLWSDTKYQIDVKNNIVNKLRNIYPNVYDIIGDFSNKINKLIKN